MSVYPLAKIFALLSWLIFYQSGISLSSPCPEPASLLHMDFDELDTLSLNTCEPLQLVLLMGAAQLMSADTIADTQLKAGICFSLIADDIQRRSKLEGFDPHHTDIAFLLKQLKAQQYNLALDRPSDWQKLWHYMKEGRWSYIANRFFDRNMHWYALGLLLIVLLWYVLRIRRNKPGMQVKEREDSNS